MKFLRHKFFFVLYISLIIAGFFSWYIQRTLTSTRAAADNVTITFSPKTGTYGPTIQQDVDLLIQTADGAKKISGIDLTLDATGPIKFTNITDPVPFPGTDTGLFNQVLRTLTDNKIRISYVSLKTDPELPSVVKIRVSYQGNADGIGKITVNQAATQIVGNVPEKAYGIGSADEGTYTITSTTANYVVSARIDPATFEVPLYNNDYQISAVITDVPEGKKISAYQFDIKYDPTLIQVIGVDPPFDAATGGDADKFTMLKKNIDATAGKIQLAYIISRPDAELPTKPKQIIHLKGLKTGAGQLTFASYQITGNIPTDQYTVNIYSGSYNVVNLNPSISVSPTPSGSCSSDYDCLDNQLCSTNLCIDLPCRAVYIACVHTVARNHTCAIEYAPNGTSCENGGICTNGICSQTSTPPPTSIPTPTIMEPTISPTNTVPTPTNAPSGNIKLNLKLKFQGILKQTFWNAGVMPVKVTIDGKQANDMQSQVVNFIANDQGVWAGTASFNATATGGYKVYIKGAQHLQKRICDSNPTETASGTYRCGDTGTITLNDGDNNLDFSQIVQLSGDLPDQDGVVDSYDMSYLRLNLGSTDSKVLSIGDLNRDGIVDTQDYSLLVASLNVKYDEL